jgi:hypothetical protein
VIGVVFLAQLEELSVIGVLVWVALEKGGWTDFLTSPAEAVASIPRVA